MKTNIFKRSLSMLMALLLCLSAFVSIGTPTAYAANTKAEVFVISFPRDGDANYSGHVKDACTGHVIRKDRNGRSISVLPYCMDSDCKLKL